LETKYKHPTNGAEFRSQDADFISETAAMADDRTLWELIRTMPGSSTPDKLVIPYANRQLDAPGAATSNALVWGNTADAIIHVMPFRAIVGSRTVVGTSPIEHMRGMVSGYHVGTSALYRSLTIAANASGNPRWDLVYATVTPDANGDTASILVKDPTTKVVSNTSQTVNKKNTVIVAVAQGTAAATPEFPTPPSDGAGSYHIALAYVYVPNGFGASSTVLRQYIHEVAPCPQLSPSVGAMSCAPANHQYKPEGTVDTRQSGQAPAGPNYYRPGAYLPSTMTGGERIIVLLQLGTGTDSHQNGDTVDDSRDWRFRYFMWHAVGGSADGFASDRGVTVTAAVPRSVHAAMFGFGHSFNQGDTTVVCKIDDDVDGSILAGTGADVIIYCDTDGALKVRIDGTPNRQIMIWLDATAPFSNYGTV